MTGDWLFSLQADMWWCKCSQVFIFVHKTWEVYVVLVRLMKAWGSVYYIISSKGRYRIYLVSLHSSLLTSTARALINFSPFMQPFTSFPLTLLYFFHPIHLIPFLLPCDPSSCCVPSSSSHPFFIFILFSSHSPVFHFQWLPTVITHDNNKWRTDGKVTDKKKQQVTWRNKQITINVTLPLAAIYIAQLLQSHGFVKVMWQHCPPALLCSWEAGWVRERTTVKKKEIVTNKQENNGGVLR